MTEQPYWTTSEVSERLGRSKMTVRNWHRRERNPLPRPAIPGGHGVEARYLKSDILAWEERERQRAA